MVTRKGVYASPDSAFYVGTARNLLDGHGLTAPPGSPPLSHFPPLFSLVLAAVGWLTGLDPLDAAGVVNALLLGVTAYWWRWSSTAGAGRWRSGVAASVAVVVALDLLVYFGIGPERAAVRGARPRGAMVSLAAAVEGGTRWAWAGRGPDRRRLPHPLRRRGPRRGRGGGAAPRRAAAGRPGGRLPSPPRPCPPRGVAGAGRPGEPAGRGPSVRPDYWSAAPQPVPVGAAAVRGLAGAGAGGRRGRRRPGRWRRRLAAPSPPSARDRGRRRADVLGLLLAALRGRLPGRAGGRPGPARHHRPPRPALPGRAPRRGRRRSPALAAPEPRRPGPPGGGRGRPDWPFSPSTACRRPWVADGLTDTSVGRRGLTAAAWGTPGAGGGGRPAPGRARLQQRPRGGVPPHRPGDRGAARPHRLPLRPAAAVFPAEVAAMEDVCAAEDGVVVWFRPYAFRASVPRGADRSRAAALRLQPVVEDDGRPPCPAPRRRPVFTCRLDGR